MIKFLFRNPQTKFVFSFLLIFGVAVMLSSFEQGEDNWFYYTVGYIPFVLFIVASVFEYFIKKK